MKEFKGKKVFLAAPYTCKDTLLRNYRVSQINAYAAELMLAGAIVFSPISMTHPISHFTHNPCPHDFWLRQSLSFIPWADVLIVLQFQGWDVSVGVKAEVARAKALGKEVIEKAPLCSPSKKGEGYSKPGV